MVRNKKGAPNSKTGPTLVNYKKETGKNHQSKKRQRPAFNDVFLFGWSMQEVLRQQQTRSKLILGHLYSQVLLWGDKTNSLWGVKRHDGWKTRSPFKEKRSPSC